MNPTRPASFDQSEGVCLHHLYLMVSAIRVYVTARLGHHHVASVSILVFGWMNLCVESEQIKRLSHVCVCLFVLGFSTAGIYYLSNASMIRKHCHLVV